ncbi:hypothetical protein ACH155_001617 [Campylobacter upsaliensis]
MKVVEANSGLLRKQKGGEAFSVFTSNAVRFRPTRCERYALEATLRRICFA